jgi:hypothetical protein
MPWPASVPRVGEAENASTRRASEEAAVQIRTDGGSARGDSAKGDAVRGDLGWVQGARGQSVRADLARRGGSRRAARPGCEVVTVPERQGLETVDILRLRGGCGAVLLEDAESTLSFLVPFGTAAQWRLPGSSCRAVPAPGAGSRWLLPPAVVGPGPVLTDPAELRAALSEAARTLAASDTF